MDMIWILIMERVRNTALKKQPCVSPLTFILLWMCGRNWPWLVPERAVYSRHR